MSDLGHHHHIVTATRPEEWIGDLNPASEALARARRQFDDILLTEQRLTPLSAR